jgi:hypothetical protein
LVRAATSELHKEEPRVFLNYTQAGLDAAYDQAKYQPNIQQLRDRWASNSERARGRIGAPLRRAYGPGEKPPNSSARPATSPPPSKPWASRSS